MNKFGIDKEKQELRLKKSIEKLVAESYAHRIWNDKDLDAIDELVHADVIIHSLLGDFRGLKAMKNVVQVWLQGFPDLKVSNDLVIWENDLVSIQWRAEGTHLGDFKGISPTNKTVHYDGITVYRIKDGEIIEYWAYLDMQQLLNQISK